MKRQVKEALAGGISRRVSFSANKAQQQEPLSDQTKASTMQQIGRSPTFTKTGGSRRNNTESQSASPLLGGDNPFASFQGMSQQSSSQLGMNSKGKSLVAVPLQMGSSSLSAVTGPPMSVLDPFANALLNNAATISGGLNLGAILKVQSILAAVCTTMKMYSDICRPDQKQAQSLAHEVAQSTSGF